MAETPSYEIIKASSRELWKQCHDLRVAVFVHEQKYPMESEIPDDHDRSPDTTHALLRLLPSGEPIGTLRVFPLRAPDPFTLIYGKDAFNTHNSELACPTFGLGRLCVLQKYRKHKFGHKLLQWAHACIRDRLLAEGACSKASGSDLNKILGEFIIHAQIQAKGFYEKCGYTAFGDIFDEDGMEHQLMRYHIIN